MKKLKRVRLICDYLNDEQILSHQTLIDCDTEDNAYIEYNHYRPIQHIRTLGSDKPLVMTNGTQIISITIREPPKLLG